MTAPNSPTPATTDAELDRVVDGAADAARSLADAPTATRAGWLRAVADALDGSVDGLVAVADAETNLGRPRLPGELARTTNQLRMFADVIEEGSWREVVIDHGDPSASPPVPDVRRMLVALGPVAVFGASNFPFAFGVAGGDTASALAAGCPVVAKAHPGHPRTSQHVADIVVETLADAGAPAGTFAVVHGLEIGRALVQHPTVRAVGFTGSLSAGRALFDLATGREDPIPFYGEMGSVNPVVVTPGAVKERRDDLVAGLVGSFTLGVGQFCTNPGLVFVPADTGIEPAVAEAVAGSEPATMLHDGIAAGWHDGLARLADTEGVTVVAGTADQAGATGSPVVFATSTTALAANPDVIADECFGPSTVLVTYDDLSDVRAALGHVPAGLTLSVHAADDDHADVAVLLRDAADHGGRVVWNGWPTGVAVNWAMHHGGPWPATTAPLHTSVGATALRRFARPVAWQDVPADLLPDALHDDNPLGLPRRVDGKLQV